MPQRLIEELRRYAITVLYLYVCFGAVVLYRAAVLHAQGIEYAPYGLAAIKAFILGKFVMLGRMVRLGERYKHKPLVYPILHQSAIFVVMLLALSIAEEAVKGFFHGQTFVESISDLGGWEQIGAVTLLLWLVMLPYLGIILLSEKLGEGRLRQIIWGRS
jgi:chromate transport protein ChrA